jgi:hypothetical protein
MLTDRPESWMDCPPDRQPDAVRGLFAAPHPGLEALLTALHTTDHAAREAAWRRTRA